MSTANININLDSKKAEKNIKDLNNSVKENAKSTESLRSQLKSMTLELQGLEPGTKRFQELTIQAGQLRDQIKDTNAVINATAGSGVENLAGALSKTAQIGIAGAQGLTSAYALFGGESEAVLESIQKMQALAGLADAFKAFGGLGDTITEIKAGFSGFVSTLGAVTPMTTAATVATEGLAVAEGEAAVAATGLGISMKSALIGTGIGAVIVGLGVGIAYLSSEMSKQTEEEKKAEKAKKQHIVAMKAQKEAGKAERQEVNSMSKEYIGLIVQLKATTAGSKERQQQINEINSKYGTTLKNIKDESLFTEQLNKSIKDYIALQVIKVRLDKNVDKIAESIDKEGEAQRKYNIALGQARKDQKLFNVTWEEFRKGVYDSNDALNLASANLQRAKLKTGDLEVSSAELAKQMKVLEDQFDGNTKGLGNNTDAQKDANAETERQIELQKELLGLQREAELLAMDKPGTLKNEVPTLRKKTDTQLTEEGRRQDLFEKLREVELDNLDKWASKQTNIYNQLITATKDKDAVAAASLTTALETLQQDVAKRKKIIEDFDVSTIPLKGAQLSTGVTKLTASFYTEQQKQLEKNKEVLVKISESKYDQLSLLDAEYRTTSQSNTAIFDKNVINSTVRLSDRQNLEKINNLSEQLKTEHEFNLRSIDQSNDDEELKAKDRLRINEEYSEKAIKLINGRAEIEKTLLNAVYTKDINEEKTRNKAKLEDLLRTLDADSSAIEQTYQKKLITEDQRNSELLQVQQTYHVNSEKETDRSNTVITNIEKANNEQLVEIERTAAGEILDIQTNLTDSIQATIEDRTATLDQFKSDYETVIGSIGGSFADIFSGDFDGVDDNLLALSDGLINIQKNIKDIAAVWEAMTLLEKIDTITDIATQAAQQVTQAIGEIWQNQMNAEQAALEDRYQNEDRLLEENLENKLITQEEFDAAQRRNEAQREDAERLARQKAFKQQQKLGITNATIGLAEAVVKTYAQFGFPVGLIPAGIVAGIGATQIATIANQKFTAARGGVVPGNGNPNRDTVDALLAPGEMVINARSASMFPSLLSNLNMAGGGIPLAPQVPNTDRPQPVIFNTGEMIKTYVVESEMSSAQRKVSRLEKNGQF